MEIQIDLDKLLDKALTGVRRASVFMGLGVNAALDPNFRSFQLSRLTRIQIVPDDISDEALLHFKDEFRLWIEAGGFRELTETFSSYLDSLYHTCLVLQAVPRKELVSSIDKTHKKFQFKVFPDKLSVLAQCFSVGPTHRDYLVSLNRARNCLTHRRGIVGIDDIRGEANFTVSWRGSAIFGETSSGERNYIDEIPEGGVLLPEGASLMVQLVERKRAFSLGAKLVLSTGDLAEICMFYDHEARDAIKSVIRFAESLGVQIQTKTT
jgi:hypothetical protein